MVCNEKQPDAELDTFMKLLIPVTYKHAPIKKITVKTVQFMSQLLNLVMFLQIFTHVKFAENKRN